MRSWLVAFWCACHRLATALEKAKEKLMTPGTKAKPNASFNAPFKQQEDLRTAVVAKMHHSSVPFAHCSDTRTWRGEERQDHDLNVKWEEVQEVADFHKMEVPSKNYLDDHREITEAAGECFDRMEKHSCMSLESVNSYLKMMEVCESPSKTRMGEDFKKEIKKQLKTKLLDDCISPHAIIAKVCEPVPDSLNLREGGAKTRLSKTILPR